MKNPYATYSDSSLELILNHYEKEHGQNAFKFENYNLARQELNKRFERIVDEMNEKRV